MTQSMREDRRSVADFDHHNPPPGMHPYDMFRELREQCPVAWSEHYGGFWIVSRYDDVARVLKDHEVFSASRELLDGEGTAFHIPSMDLPELVPNGLDPPQSISTAACSTR
jgi:cytochrome P450